MTEAPLTGVAGRPLSSRGALTRRRLLEAAEEVFAELGYHDASIVKLTEAAGVGQGTFYLYFASKKEIFDELVLDLNHRVRQAMTEAASQGETRAEREILGFTRLLPLHGGASRALSDHPPGRVRLARDAASPLRPADGADTSPGSARRWPTVRSRTAIPRCSPGR